MPPLEHLLQTSNSLTRFPDTRDSIVRALASSELEKQERAFDLVVRAYRAPVVALLRRRWNVQLADAEDLAHDFFAAALAKDWLGRFDPEKGRFRSFLRACLQAFALTERQSAARLKRGGKIDHLSLDHALEAPHVDDALDSEFEQEWVRSVLAISLAALQVECEEHARDTSLAIFRRYDIEAVESGERPSYAQLAIAFDLPVTQVTNHIAWARRRFRIHVLATLRALAGNEAEYRADVRALLGIEQP